MLKILKYFSIIKSIILPNIYIIIYLYILIRVLHNYLSNIIKINCDKIILLLFCLCLLDFTHQL